MFLHLLHETQKAFSPGTSWCLKLRDSQAHRGDKASKSETFAVRIFLVNDAWPPGDTRWRGVSIFWRRRHFLIVMQDSSGNNCQPAQYHQTVSYWGWGVQTQAPQLWREHLLSSGCRVPINSLCLCYQWNCHVTPWVTFCSYAVNQAVSGLSCLLLLGWWMEPALSLYCSSSSGDPNQFISYSYLSEFSFNCIFSWVYSCS